MTPADFDALVGEWLTIPHVAELIGADAARVRRMVQDHRLLAVRRGDPLRMCVPADLLVEVGAPGAAEPDPRDDEASHAILQHLRGTATVLFDAGFDDVEAITWLFTPDDSLPGRPIDLLRQGQRTEVRRRAQSLA